MRQFSFATQIRLIPCHLIGAVAQSLSIDIGFSEKLTRSTINACVDAIGELPRKKYDQFESVLRSIHFLAEGNGAELLIEVDQALGYGDLMTQFPAEPTPHELAAWTLLNRNEVFRQATTFEQIDRMKSWRRRDDLPQRRVALDDSNRRELGAAISELFVRAQNRGRRCTIDSLRRNELVFVFAYPDDYIRPLLEHDDSGSLKRRLQRPIFDVVFAFNEKTGTLETAAKVSPKLKDRLDTTFAKVCLGFDLGPLARGPAYHLDPLLKSSFQFVSDPTDGVEAHLRKLSLAVMGTNRSIDLTNDRYADSDMRATLKYLNPKTAPKDALRVKSARIEFRFEGRSGREGGTATVSVSPKTCNLRNQPDWRAELIQKVLSESGLMAETAKSK